MIGRLDESQMGPSMNAMPAEPYVPLSAAARGIDEATATATDAYVAALIAITPRLDDAAVRRVTRLLWPVELAPPSSARTAPPAA